MLETDVFINRRSDYEDQQSSKHVLTCSLDYQSAWRFLQILENIMILSLNPRLDIMLITNKSRVGIQNTQVLHPAWLYDLFQKLRSTSRETSRDFLAGVTEVVGRRVENSPTEEMFIKQLAWEGPKAIPCLMQWQQWKIRTSSKRWLPLEN